MKKILIIINILFISTIIFAQKPATSFAINAEDEPFTNGSNMHKISHPNDLEYSYIYCVENVIIDPLIDL